jgi:hypothetical protein
VSQLTTHFRITELNMFEILSFLAILQVLLLSRDRSFFTEDVN